MLLRWTSDMRLLIDLLGMSYKDFSIVFGVDFYGGEKN